MESLFGWRSCSCCSVAHDHPELVNADRRALLLGALCYVISEQSNRCVERSMRLLANLPWQHAFGTLSRFAFQSSFAASCIIVWMSSEDCFDGQDVHEIPHDENVRDERIR
jgi:hypothetical protein